MYSLHAHARALAMQLPDPKTQRSTSLRLLHLAEEVHDTREHDK
jgi:hypothetical protein